MKRFFALLLVVCLVFALAACGAGKSVVGTWQGKVDFAEVAGDQLGEMKDYLKEANVDFVLEMKADNTFTLKMDASTMMPALKEAFRAYMDDMLSQNNMTVADYEALTGQPVDTLIDEALSEMGDAMNQTINGTYTESGGNLILTPDDGSAPMNGTWEKDTLTLTDKDIGSIVFTRK